MYPHLSILSVCILPNLTRGVCLCVCRNSHFKSVKTCRQKYSTEKNNQLHNTWKVIGANARCAIIYVYVHFKIYDQSFKKKAKGLKSEILYNLVDFKRLISFIRWKSIFLQYMKEIVVWWRSHKVNRVLANCTELYANINQSITTTLKC